MCGLKIAIRVWFTANKILRSKYGVEERLKARLVSVNTLHLGNIRTRNDCRTDTIGTEVADELLKACNKIIVHLRLIIIETAGDIVALRQQRPTEPTVVYLCKRLTFDLVFQPRMLGMILSADTSPKHRILRLCIKNNAVEVEKCSLKTL